MPPAPTDDISPIIKKYRALVVKDKGLAETLLWGANDDKTRMRIHNVTMKVEPDLVLDPAYTRILQRQDLALIELSDAVEALLVAREAVSAVSGMVVERTSDEGGESRIGGRDGRRRGMGTGGEN